MCYISFFLKESILYKRTIITETLKTGKLKDPERKTLLRGLHHSKERIRCPRNNYTNKTRLIRSLGVQCASKSYVCDILSVFKHS